MNNNIFEEEICCMIITCNTQCTTEYSKMSIPVSVNRTKQSRFVDEPPQNEKVLTDNELMSAFLLYCDHNPEEIFRKSELMFHQQQSYLQCKH